MKYLYENKIIEEMEVRKLLSEKGFEDIRNNMSDYVNNNCNFEESDINAVSEDEKMAARTTQKHSRRTETIIFRPQLQI